MSQKRIGILRGGTGEHYKSSLKKGGDIISYIHENLSDKYKPVDILIDKDYVWHVNGLPISPSDLVQRVDVVWNTSHPSLSNILESLSIPNIGATSFFGALQNSKEMLQNHMRSIGVAMPRHIILPIYQRDFDGPRERYSVKKAKAVFEKFGSPWIVKSLTSNSNMSVHLAKTFNELVAAIEDGVKHQNSILVEEFIVGKVASVHSVAGFRMRDLPAQAGEIYVFPPANIFGEVSPLEKEKLIKLVKDLHNHLGAKHYLKSVFVLHPRGKIYLMHIDSMPNLKPNSHFSEICESVGTKLDNIVEHILESAL